jgi:AcrR family transcriptional regulator
MAKHEPADLRRQQILDAAMNCFAQAGYHPTRMDDIVRASHLSKGALYHHFSSKEEIFLGLFEHFAAIIQRAAKDLEQLPPDAAIEQQGQLLLQQLLDQRELMLVWVEFRSHAALQSRFQSIYQQARSRLANYVRHGMNKGIFKICDADAVAATITALIEGLILQSVADPSFPAIERWQQAWTQILQGIGDERGTTRRLQDRSLQNLPA